MQHVSLSKNISIIAGVVVLLILVGCSDQFILFRAPDEVSPSFQTNIEGKLDGWQPIEFSAKPFSSMMQHSFCEEGGDFDPDISSDGKLMVFSSLRHSPNPDIFIKRVSGQTATRLTSDPASEIQPCFSPTNDKVAFATNRSGNWDIWVVGVDGTSPIRMTSGVANDIHPSWSPDGKYLVYCSFGTRSQQWELWTVSTENPSVKKWIGYGMFPEWCPNPKISKIAFQMARFRGSQWFSVWTVDIIDSEARFPTVIVESSRYACICPSWSPDGTQIAYSTVSRVFEKENPAVPNTTGEDIWIVNLDGGNNHRLTISDSSDYSPTWSADGRVYFCSDREYIDNIWSVMPYEVDFKVTEPVLMGKHPQGGIQAN